MSTTPPRTEKFLGELRDIDDNEALWLCIEHARQLETELVASQRQCLELKGAISNSFPAIESMLREVYGTCDQEVLEMDEPWWKWMHSAFQSQGNPVGLPVPV